MTSETYTSDPEFHTCASSGAWMKEDSLQDLGPEEQNQTAGNFVLLSLWHHNLKKKEHKCNKEKLSKIQADKPIEKEYFKIIRKMNIHENIQKLRCFHQSPQEGNINLK